MKLYVKLTLVLGFVAGLATAALALTYGLTAPAIAEADKKEEIAALDTVFFNGMEKAEPVESAAGIKYFKVYMKGDAAGQPSFYAITGAGIGYNKSVPIELLVGFTNPDKSDVIMPDGKKADSKGMLCAGWKVIKSQETPGLGENAKNTQPSFTWLGKLSGQPDDKSKDRRTPFQKQFEGKNPQDMQAKVNISIITGATYSTVGIIDAVKNAQKRLETALGSKTGK